jgi:hypothetical protein
VYGTPADPTAGISFIGEIGPLRDRPAAFSARAQMVV